MITWVCDGCGTRSTTDSDSPRNWFRLSAWVAGPLRNGMADPFSPGAPDISAKGAAHACSAECFVRAMAAAGNRAIANHAAQYQERPL